MKIALSDITRGIIEEAVCLDFTLYVDALVRAENTLRKELLGSGKNSVGVSVFLEDLQSARLSLESADERLRALRERI